MTVANQITVRLKKVVSWIVIMAMFMTLPLTGNNMTSTAKTDDGYAGHIYFTVERITLGQGFIVEPKRVGFNEGESLAEITERVLGSMSTYEGDLASYYLQGVKDGGEPSGWGKDDIPAAITEAAGGIAAITGRNDNAILTGGDYCATSSWLFSLNNSGIQAGAGSYGYKSDTYSYDNDDVVRLQFSAYGWGQDTNTWDASWGSDPLMEFPDKDGLIRLVADFKGDRTGSAYIKARGVLGRWDASKTDIDNACTALKDEVKQEEQKLCLAAGNKVLDYLMTTVTNPTVSSIGGEWTVFALARAGVCDTDYYSKYYANAVRLLKQSNTSKISASKSTDNSRAVLAMTAIGADPHDIGGYDLLEPLSDMNYVTKQGLMGAVYALLALDSDGQSSAIRENLVSFILGKQLNDGGWGIIGDKADIDTTALVLNALAPYNNDKNVAGATKMALKLLADEQCDNGGYIGYDVENAESAAQVICALCSMGCYHEDSYQKYGMSPAMRLVDYADVGNGAFSHVIGGAADQMTTEQAAYALVAYKRMTEGKSSLFNMSADDIKPMYDMDKVNEILKAGTAEQPQPTEQPTKPTEQPQQPTIQPQQPATQPSQPTEQPQQPTVQPADNDSITTQVKSFSVKGLCYRIVGKKSVECTGYKKKSSAKRLVIPAVVNRAGIRYKVTAVTAKAFINNKHITSLTLGSNIAKIGKKAFQGCSRLKLVKIKSKTVPKTGAGAFARIKAKAVIVVNVK